jgi:putative sugar O-methyltransferase
MKNYPELIKTREAMQNQDALYRPTSFWDKASAQIVSELCANGVENFRRLPSALVYFVPTYGSPASGLSKTQVERLNDVLSAEYPAQKKSHLALDHFLSGKQHALSDYRVLLAADETEKLPYLHTFSECDVGNPIEQFEFDERMFSRSSLNYLLGLVLLKKHLGNSIPKTILEIGGGFGSLGEVLTQSGIPEMRYIDIDIPPTQFVAEKYLKAALGESEVGSYTSTAELDQIQITSLPMMSVLCSWQIERLQGKIDLFVNFISFQEMEPAVVNNYLTHVKRLGTDWILLRNMREGKQQKTANSLGVQTPIKSNDYIAMLLEYDLVEANVHPFGYQTVDGFHSELLLFKKK